MNAYANSDNVLSMMDDYLKYLQQYAETMQKMSEIKTDELSAADYVYYIEVNGRITKKLLDAGNSENNNTQNGSSANQGETSQGTTTTNRNEQAVAAAEEIADFYATVSPKLVETLLIDDYGFTYTQALYGIAHADIDWGFYAVIHLEEYYGMNEGRVTKEDAEYYLVFEKGYSDDAIQYAFNNASID